MVVFEGDGDYAGYQAIVRIDYEQISSYEWYHHINGWIVEGGLPRS